MKVSCSLIAPRQHRLWGIMQLCCSLGENKKVWDLSSFICMEFFSEYFLKGGKIIKVHPLMVEDTGISFSELTLVPIYLTFKCRSICSIKMPDKVFELVWNGRNEIRRQVKLCLQAKAESLEKKRHMTLFLILQTICLKSKELKCASAKYFYKTCSSAATPAAIPDPSILFLCTWPCGVH